MTDFWHRIAKRLLVGLMAIALIWNLGGGAVQAKIDDDSYDGNVFILYAGNGSLVPPRLTLAQTRERKLPAILVYYTDDSADCKQFSVVVSQLQAFYGKAASLIPVAVDSLPTQDRLTPNDEGYYYKGKVPQTVILDGEGKVRFDRAGQVAYEAIDDVLREVFDLLPRAQSVELKRRSFNEFNTELRE